MPSGSLPTRTRRSVPLASPVIFGREHILFGLFLVFLASCLIGGGSARADVYSLLYIRPMALLVLLAMLWQPAERTQADRLRPLWLLLLAFALSIAIQLIPLPPAMWTALPGRAPFVAVGTSAGLTPGWHPISLSPDLTLNSLISLLPGAAALMAVVTLRDNHALWALLGFVLLALVSALWAVIQFAGGPNSSTYLYEVTTRGIPVGLFANRNHQAVFLAAILPLLGAWVQTGPGLRGDQRFWLAAGLTAFLFPLILMTGSRSGSVLGLVGIAIGFALARSKAGLTGRKALVAWVVGGLVLLALASTLLLGRAVSLQRVMDLDLSAEQRVRLLPVVLDVLRDMWTVGSGFGTFDPVFRAYEPSWALKPSYFNHAHNEVLEVLLTGGIAAGVAVLAFLYWFFWSVVRLARNGRYRRKPLAVAAAGAIAILLLACLTDYPLRTPLLGAFFAYACGWLALSVGEDRKNDAFGKKIANPVVTE
jgi:O-antigen ligase